MQVKLFPSETIQKFSETQRKIPMINFNLKKYSRPIIFKECFKENKNQVADYKRSSANTNTLKTFYYDINTYDSFLKESKKNISNSKSNSMSKQIKYFSRRRDLKLSGNFSNDRCQRSSPFLRNSSRFLSKRNQKGILKVSDELSIRGNKRIFFI